MDGYRIKDRFPPNLEEILRDNPNISSLEITGRKIKEIPDIIFSMVNLRELMIVNTGIKAIPNEISRLINLENLEIKGNKSLEKLFSVEHGNSPEGNTSRNDGIYSLKKLRYLRLFKNKLEDIPNGISNLKLKSLYINGNFIKRLPDDISGLKKLEILIMSDNKLEVFPEGVYSLERLVSLDIGSNFIKDIPDGISNLMNLSELSFAGNNDLSKLPNDIGRLSNLQALELDSTSIENLPEDLSGWKGMENLSLSDTKLKTLPEGISSLVSLESLNMEESQLIFLPESMGKLHNLVKLGINHNKLESLPESMSQLENLRVLNCEFNKLKKLPNGIGNMKKLEILLCTSNELEELPESIGDNVNLSRLRLFSNNLRTLPDGIGKLDKLAELLCSKNMLEKIPYSINGMKRLEDFRLNSNQLTTLPDSIGLLPNLTHLDLVDNKFETFPQGIMSLKKLNTLDISENPIKVIPETIGDITTLSVLYASECKLEELPESIGKLRNLEELNVSHNELTEIPRSISYLYNLRVIDLSYNKLENGVKTINILRPLENLAGIILDRNPNVFFERLPRNYREYNEEDPLGHYIIKDFVPQASKKFKKLVRKKFPKKGPKMMKWQQICLIPGLLTDELFYLLIEQAFQVSLLSGRDTSIEDIEKYFNDEFEKKHEEFPSAKRGMGLYNKRFICEALVEIYEEYLSHTQDDFDRVCQSSESLIGDEWGNVPFGEIVMYKSNNDKKVYCFTVDELLSIQGGINPYNREKIPEDAILQAETKKEIFRYLTTNEEEDPELEEKLLFGVLWDKLDSVPTYPVDRDIFLNASREQVDEMYSLLRVDSDPYSRNLKNSLDRIEPHLDFVKQSLNLIRNVEEATRDGEEHKRIKYLIDWVIKQILLPNENMRESIEENEEENIEEILE